MNALGLYGLKPWFGDRLTPVREFLISRGVRPDAISAAGLCCGAAAGLALALGSPGPILAILVGAWLIARLACANLDGAVARQTGRTSRFGAVLNELCDRGAELAALAGCLALAPAWLVVATALAASAPSWISLAGAATGATRIQGGPVGKTERCLLLIAIAATGLAIPLLAAIALGSLLTAAIRLARLQKAIQQ